MAGRVADRMCRWLLGPDSVNPEKNAEEGGWDLEKVCWGLTYKTEPETVTLPEAKLLKAGFLLADQGYDPGRTWIRIHDVQVLRGSAQHWTTVQPMLAPELGALDRILGCVEEGNPFAVPRRG